MFHDFTLVFNVTSANISPVFNPFKANTCDDSWDMLNNSYPGDTEGMISDADPGL